MWRKYLCLVLLILSLQGCSDKPANYPYGRSLKSHDNIFFSSFDQQPKTLDPARSYSVEEATFLGQIVEPPLQYAYLTRPYQLIPATAAAMPEIMYLDKHQKILPQANDNAVYTLYRIHIKPHIYYQPHPAFKQKRELLAEDYAYQIKRLAAPQVSSPLSGLMQRHILGFAEFAAQLKNKGSASFIDLRQYPLAGVQVIDRYTYDIIIKDNYPQFPYWLATNFFAPTPWEVDLFYSQEINKKKGWTFNTYPVGTGAYMMLENNPNNHIILTRNPNFRMDTYPKEGTPEDKAAGFLADTGKQLPFVDTFYFNLEKESIPRWNKFLQGYYDISGIATDNFDQAIRISSDGNPQLSKEFRQKGMVLQTSFQPGIFYFGFNMLDSVVGGYSVSQQKLRQAIAIAVNTEEYISIFLNGRGRVAHQPLPPDIVGSEPDSIAMNTFIYESSHGQLQRKSLTAAKQLLAEAGYPDGISTKTGKPLILSYDAISGQGSDERSQFDWMQKQLAQLGIQLIVNDTNYNRFQEKIRTGNAQLFFWGWLADYPDPENFYFLLYGANSKVKNGGENATNYSNPQFDRLFEKMKSMTNSDERQPLIHQMNQIFQQDTPWFSAFYTQSFQLSQPWITARKLNSMSYNTLKYVKIDPTKRVALQKKWNTPHWSALWIIMGLGVLISLPLFYKYWRLQRRKIKKIQFKQ